MTVGFILIHYIRGIPNLLHMQWQLRSDPQAIPMEARGLEIQKAGNEYVMLGGLSVTPDIQFTDTASGSVFYHQLCLQHRLKFVTAGDDCEFVTRAEPYRDSPADGASAISTYFVKDNVVETPGRQPSRLFFTDWPRMALSIALEEVQYDILFETWLQYGMGFVPRIPLLKFRWSLEGIASKRNGAWAMTHAKHTSAAEIRQSVQVFPIDASPLEINKYPSLKQEVRTFFGLHQALTYLLDE